MDDDLHEIRDRLLYCRAEITQINGQVRDYCGEGVEFRGIRIDNNREIQIQAKLKGSVPIPLRSKVGCVVNDLRSILDNLAIVLAERHHGANDSTYFPISASQCVFGKDGMQKIKALSPADQKTIIDLGPYPEKNPTLFALHRLDISRKHGRLAVQSADVDAYGIQLKGDGTIEYLLPIHPMPEIRSEWVTIARLRMTIRLRVSPIVHLAFKGQKQVDGQQVGETLDLFHQEVSRIVAIFDAPAPP